MGAITFNRFDLGIDLRKGGSVSDANRLREMKNAHVTTGLATEKRPGFTKITTLPPDTKGLFAGKGYLNVFSGVSGSAMLPPFARHTVSLNGGTTAVTDILSAEVFNGKIYVAVQYADGTIKHHYLNGSTTQVSDTNCPHTGVLIKGAQKIFALSADGSTVRYSKTGDPTNWTAATDAGFLPTGMNARGDSGMWALGLYQSKLVALADDAAQVWTIDPDPSAMKLDEVVEGVGSTYHSSLATVGGDLYFASHQGFRSITTMQLVNKMTDVDIGSPIDTLVKPALYTGDKPRSIFYDGRYICFIGQQMFVYAVSRTAKIAAWSRYTIPFTVDHVAQLDGKLYVRVGDDVYKLDEESFTDDGELYEVKLELPFMDFKTPGILKQVYAIDLVMDGECFFSMGFDARQPDAITPEVRVAGITRGGGLVPLECCGTEFSARFRNYDDKPFRLDALTVYYNDLGPTY